MDPINQLVLRGTGSPVISSTQTREVVTELPVQVERVETSTLDIGQEQVVREGRTGRLITVYEDTYTNGIKTGERLVEIKEHLLPIKRLILVGTRPKQVTRTQLREVVEHLPLEIERVVTTTLKPGEERVLRQGQAGRMIKVYEDTYTNGVRTQERVFEIKAIVPPIKTMVLVGALANQPLTPSPAVGLAATTTSPSSRPDAAISEKVSDKATAEGLATAPLAMSATGLLSVLGLAGLKKSDVE